MPWNNQDGGQNNGQNNGPQGGQAGGQPTPGASGKGGPWGNTGNRPNGGGPPNPGPGPGGKPPGGKGPSGPDFDAWMQHLRDLFRRHFGFSGPARPGNRGNIAIIVVGIIGALWLLSGFYRVEQDEQAIPKIFGNASESPVGPGLHYIWPAPIGSVVHSRTGTENRIEVGFNSAHTDVGKRVFSDSLMLTGDENVIDIKFVVLWKINDPFKFEFGIRNQEHTIVRAAESAIREVVSETPIQTALTEGREEIAAKTRTLLQKMLDEYGAGVTIDGIELQEVSPPEPVKDAFNDVQRARSDAERARNDAEAYRNSILPRAQGEAARKRQEATGYKAEIVNRATGDADRFKAVDEAYAAAKEVTQRRIYLETMEQVLKGARKIVTDTGASTPIVLPMGNGTMQPLPATPDAGATPAASAMPAQVPAQMGVSR